VRIGDDIGAWKVTQIEERKLVLSLNDRSATFTLFAGQHGGPGEGQPVSAWEKVVMPNSPKADLPLLSGPDGIVRLAASRRVTNRVSRAPDLWYAVRARHDLSNKQDLISL
jgi:hypothetical protein